MEYWGLSRKLVLELQYVRYFAIWGCKTVFLFAIIQYLSPIFITPIAKNPTAVILNLKYYYTNFSWDSNVNLRESILADLNIYVVEYCIWVYAKP